MDPLATLLYYTKSCINGYRVVLDSTLCLLGCFHHETKHVPKIQQGALMSLL